MLYSAHVTMLRILFLFISCSCVLTQETTVEKGNMDVFRLPNNTEPLYYKLTIKPILNSGKNSFTFTGDVTINIKVKTSTEVLTLNADDLQINEVNVIEKDSAQKVEVIKPYLLDAKNEQLKIQLEKPGLIADRVYDVQISYSGKLRNDMSGFYASSYTDNENNSTKWLAVTQFEPTYARRAFPCYDEPAFKTPFSISVIRMDTQISLSNMPVDRQYQVNPSPPNYICDQYQTTEPMSTYLVAFSVSEFVNTTNNQRIYVYTHKEYIEQVTYIEKKAEKLLDLMEIYTHIPYPYSKVDLLAVPDFSFGAMENWGLNTYREKYLLVSDKSTAKDKELVTTVVQHELSHQWFGDLVTCSWWNYVWLNEAFATLFEYFGVQVIEPEWRIGDVFIIEQHQEALAYDHRPKHPITASVNTPDEIQDIFDTISYNKGASVLRMLKFALNDDIFRTSLSQYLDTYKYKSVEPKNLWDTFDNVLFDKEYKLGTFGSAITVGEFMSSWIDQAGYPVIHIGKSKDNSSLVVTQKRFQVDQSTINDTTLWHIGLTYTYEKKKDFSNLQPSVWMNNTKPKITIPFTNDAGWVIFNLQSTGFYRVNYDLRNWDLLIAQLNYEPKSIHLLNRAQLIDDSFNLARADELPYSVPFNLITYLILEDDFIPWYSVKNSMSYLVERLRRCSVTGPQIKNLTRVYAKMAYQKVRNLYEKNDGKHFTNTSMNAFSNWACKLDVEECVNSVSNYFKNWQNNGVEIPPDVKEAALCVGVKNGTEQTWNKVFELFLSTSSTSERKAALLALSCSTNSTILSKYINLFADANGPIRPQDYKITFKSLVSTPIGINVTTEFLQKVINQSISLWGGEETINLIYSNLAASVATGKEVKELNAIRNYTSLSPTLKESFDNSFKEVELNLAYFDRSHPLIHKWFSPSLEPTTEAPSGAILTSYPFINVIVLSLLFVIINNSIKK